MTAREPENKRRDKFSKSRGWKVLRFPAQEVKLNVNKFIKILKKEIASVTQSAE